MACQELSLAAPFSKGIQGTNAFSIKTGYQNARYHLGTVKNQVVLPIVYVFP